MQNSLRAIHSLFVLLVCVLFLTTGQAYSQPIRVGFSQGYGITAEHDGKSYTGYTYQLLKELSRYNGWQYEFVQCAWSDCVDMLSAGEIDVFGPMQRTPDRAEKMSFPELPQGYEYGALYSLASNNRFFFNDFQGFNGMRVAIVHSSFFTDRFQAFCTENDFRVSYVFVDDINELITALETGAADAFISGNLMETPNVKVLAKFAVEPLYYAVNRHKPELLNQLILGLNDLRKDQIYFDATLYQQFYGDSITSRPAFTREEIEFIRTAPTFTVTMDPGWSPLEYVNENGEYAGILPDILRLLERESGLRFRFVKSATYEQALQLFTSAEVDMVTLRQYKGYTGANIQITQPLLDIPVMLVSRMDASHRVDLPLGILHSAPYETEASSLYSDSTFLPYRNTLDGIKQLRTGKVKALLVNSYVFDDLVRDPGNKDLRLLAASQLRIPLRLGVNYPDSRLASVLDKSIARLKQDDVNSIIYSNTLTPSKGQSLMAVLSEYALPLTVSGLIIMLLVLAAVLTNKHRVEGMLTEVAFTDSKTGIGNWNRMERSGPELMGPGKCFVTMDVNNFKLLNDYFGYEAGDKALRHIATEIQAMLRFKELAVRVESDIFCLLLNAELEDDVRDRLTALTAAVVNFRPLTSVTGFTMSLSFGMCMSGSEILTVNIMRDRANVVRKLFKNAYRTTYAFYDEEIHNHIIQEREIENKMEEALENGEFQAYFQPKYDLRNDCIVGAEALVRWIPPTQGTIYPCNFIPLFERNGFIVKLDMYVLESVCKYLQDWTAAGLTPVPVSVNISKLHVLNPDFVADVMRMVNKYNIPPSLLELELTETAFLENTELLLRIMNEFSAKGFTLSMDDFGTGYSSLNMLQEIPVHVLKLDRAFLDMSNDSARAKNIIAHVVHMAKDLNMQVVSEGVETVDHVRFLKNVGCDMAQGFFYSPPVPAKAFSEMAFTHTLPSSLVASNT